MDSGGIRFDFISLLRALLDRFELTSVVGASPADTPGSEYSAVDVPRFEYVLSGTKPVRCRHGGGVGVAELKPGSLLVAPPFGWSVPLWDREHEFISIIHYRMYLRFVHARCRGDGVQPRPDVWHTATPPHPSVLSTAEALTAAPEGCGPEPRSSLFKALVFLDLRELELQEGSGAGKGYQTFRGACDYVQRNAHRPIDRREVADALLISATHVSRLFAEFDGAGFADYLARVRMERAAALLADRTLPVKLVARRCGYGDDSHFIKVFARRFGTSPGRWRLGVPPQPENRGTFSP